MKAGRTQRKHESVTQEIIATARAIMREEGAAALSMQELARRLDMRAPSLYNYFSGKNEIYDALFRLGFGQFAAYIEEKATGAQTWQEELQRFLEAYMAFALENPELYQLCFERPVPGFVPSPASLEISFGTLTACLCDCRPVAGDDPIRSIGSTDGRPGVGSDARSDGATYGK